jgi:hypothetical protein
MSRYRKEKGNLTLSYGFDHALGYWYDITDSLLEEDDPKFLLEEKSSTLNKMKRSEFIQILREFNVNEDHIMGVAGDLVI